MRVLEVEEALRDWARLLTSVITRNEPVAIRSRWGEVVILPRDYFEDWSGPVARALAIAQPENLRIDAGRSTRRWDAVSEVVDTDSGTWLVGLGGSEMLIDLDRRFIVSDALEGRRRDHLPERLETLVACRVGSPLGLGLSDGGMTVRTSADLVVFIIRVDDGDRAEAEPSLSEPGDSGAAPAIVVSSAVARDALLDLIADVASREDSVLIGATGGIVRLVPDGWFASLVDLAEMVVTLREPIASTSDAGVVVLEGKSVSELRDTDTGTWSIRSAGQPPLIVSLDRRVWSSYVDAECLARPVGPEIPFSRLEACRVGRILRVGTPGSAAVEHANVPADFLVEAIERLDDWSFA